MAHYRESTDWFLVIPVAIFLLILALCFTQPYFEAKYYEQLTGKHVTYWDAVWLDLRVQEQVKDDTTTRP